MLSGVNEGEELRAAIDARGELGPEYEPQPRADA